MSDDLKTIGEATTYRLAANLAAQVEVLLIGADGPESEHNEVRRAAAELVQANAPDPLVKLLLAWVRQNVELWERGERIYRTEDVWQLRSDTDKTPARRQRVQRAFGALMEGYPEEVAKTFCCAEGEYLEAQRSYAEMMRPVAPRYVQESLD